MNASKIAKYILHKANQEEDLISNMKLQKLLYYSQGFHLAIFDKPLFVEEIIHWIHGPVVRDVYFKYNHFGNKAIEYQEDEDFSDIDNQSLNLIDEVLDVYGQFTASALRNMSHKEPPWEDTKNEEVITHEAMKKYFKTRITENVEEG